MDDTEKLTIESEQRLNTLIILSQQAIKISISALKRFPTAQYKILDFTFINYLERFTYSLESIEILLNNFQKKPNNETSIGLIIRASLLDFMNIIFLSSYYVDITPENPNSQEEFDNQFEALVSDQIHNMIKYLILMKDHNLISKDEFKQSITNLNSTYNFLFNGFDLEDPISTLKIKKFNSTKKIFQRICNHHKTKNYAMVYDLYTYYSKYEHFGIMTHFMQRQNINKDLDRIILSINYIIQGIKMVFLFLDQPANKLVVERKQLNDLSLEFNKLKI